MNRPIDAIKALRDGGISLLAAKRAYEALVQQCELRLHLPGVADLAKLTAYLAECGITAVEVQPVSITLNLRVPLGHRVPLRITVIKLLAHQGGLGLPRAHALLNRLLVECNLTETLPAVSNLPQLIEDLAKADVAVTVVQPALAE